VNQMTFQPLRNPGASTMKMMSEAAAITMHNQAKVQISSSTLSLISNSLLDSDDTKVEGMTVHRDAGHSWGKIICILTLNRD
jgi:hypothetical protein